MLLSTLQWVWVFGSVIVIFGAIGFITSSTRRSVQDICSVVEQLVNKLEDIRAEIQIDKERRDR